MSNITEQQAVSLSESTLSPHARIARVVREASGRIGRVVSEAASEASGRVGKVAGEAASDIAVVVRDELGRLAALFRPELRTVGKGLAALCVAALGGLLALGFANVALLGLLTKMLPLPWAALVLAGIWGAVALLCLRFARAQVRRLMDLKGTAREGPPLADRL
ncbi:MAG: phage holin family protein [Gammaproteobacteria bacterium]